MIHSYGSVVAKSLLPGGVADPADLIGDLELGEESSVWFTTVVRGDGNFIRVGRETNLQDGAVVSPATLAPGGSLLMGAPARLERSVAEKDLDLMIDRSAEGYTGLAAEYRASRGA